MLELLTNEENNLMLYDALHDKDLTKFFYLLKQGYALTPFLLNCMIDYGYEKHIEKALCVCDRCSFAIYDFFCIYWGVDKTEDFFVKNSYTKVIQKRFSTKSLVKYQLWELLAERREYVVLAEHGQIELLKKLKQENPSDHLLGVREALRKVNAVEALAELKDWIGLAGLPEGELKLFELKEWRYVDFDKVSFLRNVPPEQLLQEVYEASRFSLPPSLLSVPAFAVPPIRAFDTSFTMSCMETPARLKRSVALQEPSRAIASNTCSVPTSC